MVNTIHYGLGIGLEYNYIEDINTYSTFNLNTLEGLGIRGEAYFYPLRKNFFSLGVLSSFSIGTSPYIFNEGMVSNTSPTQTDKYFYNHVNIGAEAALGVPFLKILTIANKQIQRNNLERTTGSSMMTFDEELNRKVRKIIDEMQAHTNSNKYGHHSRMRSLSSHISY